jgi:hypothetical protein
MTGRTRYFVIASLLVLGVGLGAALVAYYTGFATSAFQRGGGPGELELLPHNATLVGYANVREIMTSTLRERFRKSIPAAPDGQRDFQDRTGINIETDIDRIVACLAPPIAGSGATSDASGGHPAGLVLARGRFDEVRIEALMREHGATVESYKGARIVVSSASDKGNSLAVAFVESGLVALGSPPLVRRAIDLKTGGGDSVASNAAVMNLVRSLDTGNAWAVGRFDALTSQARFPDELARQLPPITWFSASGRVNGGITGVLRADARDEAAAVNLRDVVRGFVALAKLQSSSRPGLQTLVDSLELGGTGTTVSLGFSIPAEVFDLMQSRAGTPRQPGN